MRIINIILLAFLFTFSNACFASWSNYFRFVNNFNFPLLLSIHSDLADVNNSCGGDSVSIEAHKTSCEIEFTTDKKNWYEPPGNRGTITITKKNDPSSYCIYNYDYTFKIIPYDYFNLHSENFSLQSCSGTLKPQEISVITDHTKFLPKKLAGDFLLNAFKNKAPHITESISQADCGGEGGDNCMIASPDLNTLYLAHGSTLAEGLRLQARLDRYEPLNFEQFIGSHNSAISTHYTNSTNVYNMSYSDPDHYLSLTEQLNAGVRQLELDIEWYKDTVAICHNHVSLDLQGVLCEGNAPLKAAVNEIKSWVEKNPQELIFVYLDVNLPLTGHVANLDEVLANFEPYVLTPALTREYFHRPDNALPASDLTQDILINTFKKNIIVTNDDDVDNLKSSKYVFVSVANSADTPLPEVAVDTFLASAYSACDANKYQNMPKLFYSDANHYNLWRSNEDRTVINFISCSDDKHPDIYNDYFTTASLPNMLTCPFNLLSMNMIGFTCNASDCEFHPTDPRLTEFLWSWEVGYPLKNGSDIAYINPVTGHFENNVLTPKKYSVLCYLKSSKQKTPQALQWYIKNVDIKNPADIFPTAQKTCESSGGVFAVPTVSYWMSDALQAINQDGINPYDVLVNYTKENNDWMPAKYAS